MVMGKQPIEPPSRDIVCSWVQAAWEGLDAVENGFRASRIVIDTDAQVEELSRVLGLAELREAPQMDTED